ncbi:MAG: hypothetical protein AB1597_02285 [Chloroflexota bacterium]
MSTELHDSRGAPVLPRLITHMGDGSTPLTNRNMTDDINNCRLSLSALASRINSRSRSAARIDGTNVYWGDEGTPIPASTKVTLLEVSGYGGLKDLFIGCKDYNTNVRPVITTDSVSVFTGSFPNHIDALENFLGSGNDGGIVQHLRTLATPDRYAIVYHLGHDGFGFFDVSAKVEIENFHVSDSRKVMAVLFYSTGASVQFVEDQSLVVDPAEVRRELANKLTLDEEEVTVALAYNWSKELKRNVPSVITLVHRKTLSEAADTEVRKVMLALKAPESGI